MVEARKQMTIASSESGCGDDDTRRTFVFGRDKFVTEAKLLPILILVLPPHINKQQPQEQLIHNVGFIDAIEAICAIMEEQGSDKFVVGFVDCATIQIRRRRRCDWN